MPPKVLEVNNLKTRFHTDEGTVHAVNGVSFYVGEGETLGIVGESGCGKSVSVLSVMRLIPQPPGEVITDSVMFYDRNLVELKEEEMREVRGSQIAMIFQDPMTSLNPVLTIGFQVMEPMLLHLGMSEEEAQERAADLLNMVGIPEAADRLDDYPHQFSGGMRQRAMIAMALGCNPPLLIADEPTTALDVTIQAQIVDLVKRLRDRLGMSLIWITHDLGVIAGLADRVMVMYAGFVVEEADIGPLYKDPRHPYTYALLQSLPHMDRSPGEALMSIEGRPPELYELPNGCAFAPRCAFVQEKCWGEIPQLNEVAPGHRIACFVNIKTGELQ
ncbi:MAG: ABC transporter ATP-binding protein [Anaerolineales bacterium]